MPETKQCLTCEKKLPLDDFYFNKSKGRHDPNCKACTKERLAKFRDENRDKVKAAQKKYRAAHPEVQLAINRKAYHKRKALKAAQREGTDSAETV
jgi:hypothetical protein